MFNALASIIFLVLMAIGTITVYSLCVPLVLKISAWKNNKCLATLVEETNGISAIKFAYAEIKANDYDFVVIRNYQTGEDYLTIKNWRRKIDEQAK